MDSLVLLEHSLDGLPFGVTLWRAETEDADDLRLVYANAQASRAAGFDLKRHLGQPVAQVLGPQRSAPPLLPDEELKVRGLASALHRTGDVVPRSRYVDDEGIAREFRIHMVPVWERTVALVYEQLEEAGRSTAPSSSIRIYFEDIVKTLHEPLGVVDQAYRLQWANDVWLRLFGLHAPGFVGRDLLGLAALESKDLLRKLLDDAVEASAPDDEETLVRVTRFDGEQRTCRVHARRLNQGSDDTPLVLVTLQDESERLLHQEIQRSLVEQLVRARDDERRALARELHDHIGQELTALSVHLHRLGQTQNLQNARRLERDAQQRVERLAEDVTTLVNQLHPYRLQKLGLPAALQESLREFEAAHEVKTDCHFVGFDDGERLDPDVEVGVFRIVQEALTNVARHSGAQSVNVLLHRHANSLRVLVEDDGCGFEPERPPTAQSGRRGLGLTGLRERAQLLGGTLTLESSPGNGTMVGLSIPLSSSPESG